MTRIETDSMGTVEVPDEAYWGAQTQRSLTYFDIGIEKMPIELIHAYGVLKEACAETNRDLGLLKPDLAALIIAASDGLQTQWLLEPSVDHEAALALLDHLLAPPA